MAVFSIIAFSSIDLRFFCAQGISLTCFRLPESAVSTVGKQDWGPAQPEGPLQQKALPGQFPWPGKWAAPPFRAGAHAAAVSGGKPEGNDIIRWNISCEVMNTVLINEIQHENHNLLDFIAGYWYSERNRLCSQFIYQVRINLTDSNLLINISHKQSILSSNGWRERPAWRKMASIFGGNWKPIFLRGSGKRKKK